MYKATTMIEAALKERGLKCISMDMRIFSFVELGFSGDNCTFKMRFISDDDGNDVKMLTDNICKVPKEKLPEAYALVNEMNRTYKYLKFSLDNEGNFTAQYDLLVSTSDSELPDAAFEVTVRTSKIVDDVYPKIMKLIWS